MKERSAYTISCLVFFILIGSALLYSGFFYPFAQPMGCLMHSVTGHDCPTCGFSRAFSYFTHFRIHEGKAFNGLAFGVFLFFLSQFFLRGTIVLWTLVIKRQVSRLFVRVELLTTVAAFVAAFLPVVISFKSYCNI